MINKLLVFKFTNKIFYTILIGFVHIGNDQNLYVNLNFFLASYIPLLLILEHKFSAFKNPQTCKEKLIQNQNREEGKCRPISLQISIWHDKNSNQLPYVCTSCQSTYLSNVSLPTYLVPYCLHVPLIFILRLVSSLNNL